MMPGRYLSALLRVPALSLTREKYTSDRREGREEGGGRGGGREGGMEGESEREGER